MYDPSVRPDGGGFNHQVCLRAADFFDSVARAMPHTKPEAEDREVYPQCEDRKLVAAHLQRERSRLLSRACKERDDYQCQVCGFRFVEFYGKWGEGFAEAHHLVPLRQLKGKVKTRIEDLATVCANCHRMLHRMAGKRGDVAKLKHIVRQRKAR
jgi:predicted HNH restriction endonuclease